MPILSLQLLGYKERTTMLDQMTSNEMLAKWGIALRSNLTSLIRTELLVTLQGEVNAGTVNRTQPYLGI